MKMKVKIKKYLLLVPFVLTLQGCFILIPGSVIGGVSDAITGDEGMHCVSEKMKVGDKVNLPGGGIGTIKSLSGKSVRCENENLPIRALLIFENEKEVTGDDVRPDPL
jgi:hypothetical protein